MTTDPMLAKVRKLLAKAEDPAATAHEAEVYTAKAAQLIADYGIDRALLAAADPSRDPVGDRVVDLDPPYAADKAELLATVATRLRCKAVHRTRATVRTARSCRSTCSATSPTSSAPTCCSPACSCRRHRAGPGRRASVGAQGGVPPVVAGGLPHRDR